MTSGKPGHHATGGTGCTDVSAEPKTVRGGIGIPTAGDPLSQAIRVLIIDDDEDDYIITRDLLAEVAPEVKVSWVSEPRAALTGLEGNHDLWLVDYQLGPTTGTELIREARRQGLDVPSILLTGARSRAIDVEAMNAGAVDYLVKGEVDGPLLERAIRYAISRNYSKKLENHLFHTERLAALGQLAAGVAHEINNPAAFVSTNLTAIQQWIEHLRPLGEALDAHARACREQPCTSPLGAALPSEPLGPLLAEMAQAVADSQMGIARIAGIVRDMRGFTSPGATESSTSVQVNDLVEAACKMVRSEIVRCASLVKSLAVLPLVELVEPRRLQQVLVNLLINATQAIDSGHPEENEIRVTTLFQPFEQQIVIAVEDTGRGIDPELAPYLFQPFFTTKRRDSGTGLGLALSAQMIATYGGLIRWESTPGKGTRFEVRLPSRSNRTQAPNERQRRKSSVRLPLLPGTEVRPAKLLLIDDEPHLLKAFERVLRPHHVVTAHGGAEAIALLSKQSGFELILCDMAMPGVNGPMVYEALQRAQPALVSRFVFMTGGLLGAADGDAASALGVPVLTKPICSEDVLSLLERGRGDSLRAGSPGEAQLVGRL